MAPTDTPVMMSGISIYRAARGKIMERNYSGRLTQL